MKKPIVPGHREQIADFQGQIRPYKESIMSQSREQRRKEAMKRYLAGEKVKDICRALSCSKSFLYRWRRRLNLADAHNGWEKERSRRPLKSPLKTPEGLCTEIVRLKNALRKNGYRVGAPAIQQALRAQGIEPAPSKRTIYRILARQEKEVKNPPKHPESVHPPENIRPL